MALHISDRSPLFDDEHVHTEESLLKARELARIARFEELADPISRTGEASLLFGCFHPERDRQVRLAGPDRAGEDQIHTAIFEKPTPTFGRRRRRDRKPRYSSGSTGRPGRSAAIDANNLLRAGMSTDFVK